MTKKFYSVIGALLIMLCLPMSLMAQIADLADPIAKPNPDGNEAAQQVWGVEAQQQLFEGSLPAAKSIMVPATRVRKAPRKTITKVSDLAGTYVMTYKALGNKGLDGGLCTTITEVEGADSILITNFYNSGDVVKAHVDLQTMAVTIPNQVLGTNTTYGNYDLAIITEAGKPDRTKPITGTINADGTISFNSWWAVFVMSGTYKDSYFGAHQALEFEKSNAMMGHTYYSSSLSSLVNVTYGVVATQTAQNIVAIKNFANHGRTVEIVLNNDSSATIPKQLAYQNKSNGTEYSWYTAGAIYKDGYTGLSAYSNNITCDKATTARKISWGDWTMLANSKFYSYTTAGWVETQTDIQYPNISSTSWEGTGTTADPYQIKTLEDLVLLADKVNSATKNYGEYARAYQGVTFKMMNDIDISNYRFTPIGQSAYQRFDGTFDGGGHTLKGLNVNTGQSGYAGLFGYADSLSVIKNINVDTPSVNTDLSVAGTIVARTNGLVENCHVKGGTVSCTSLQTAAGISGIAVSVKNCSAEDMIITATGGYAGGIAGQIYSTITNCHATNVSITAGGVAQNYPSGGVVASLYGGRATNCYFTGTVDGTQQSNLFIGGVAGQVRYNGSIDQCFASGTVSGYYTTAAVGGIAGYLNGTISNSYSNCSVLAGTSSNVGGIAGYVADYTNSSTGITYHSTIKNCYAAGLVVANTYLYNKETDQREVIGTVADTGASIANIYFDTQMTDFGSTQHRSNSAELTSATGPNGFPASIWTFTEGYYPRLKANADTEAAKWSASLPLMDSSNCLDMISRSVALKALGKTSFYLIKNGAKGQAGNFCSISGDSLALGSEFGKDTLYVTNPSAGTRSYAMNIAPVPFAGAGTEDNPFLIKTKNDLIQLSEYTTNGNQYFPNTYFKVANDIDMELDTCFVGICADASNTDNRFAGHIDGDGHTLSRLVVGNGGIYWQVKPEDSASGYGTPNTITKNGPVCVGYKGFIGRMASEGSLKNLSIAADSKLEFWSASAAFVGYNYGTIENCRNYAEVKTLSSYVGGIAGTNLSGGVIRNCYNAGRIHTGYEYAGGITGENNGLIEYCENAADVSYTYLSTFSKKTDTFLRATGGITGGNNYGRISNCVNSGTVTSNKWSGGIIGQNPSSTSTTGGYDYHAEMVNCVNYGQVFSNSDNETVGAAIGYNLSKGEIKNNFFDKQISQHRAASNSSLDGITELSTDSLTSGEALSGFDTSMWQFTKGEYPVLKQFADEALVKTTRRIIISVDNSETVGNLHNDVALSTNDGCTWALGEGTTFKIEDNTLKSPESVNTIITDTLIARVGNVVKPIVIKSLPSIPVSGNGTQASPYLINNAADWNALAKYVASCSNSLEGQYVAVTADIDFNGGTITPFSYDDVTLLNAADFDGRGHTVKNFTYTPSTTYRGAGFATIGKNCHVHDITFDGTVTATVNYTAGVVGKLYGKLTNVTNKSAVTNTKQYTAGMIAQAKSGSRIINCVNEGDVEGTTYTAGFTSYSEDSVYYKNCSNKGTVTYASSSTKSYVGGFIALCYPDTLIACHNEGKISAADGTHVAGLIAYANAVSSSVQKCYYVKDCYNTADVTALYSLAGLMGEYNSNGLTRVVMDGCYNTGNVSSTRTTSYSGNYTAGLCMYYSKSSVYTNCWNSGNVSSTAVAFAGGVFAYNKGTISSESVRTVIRNCHNTGNVTVGEYGAGGVTAFLTNYITLDSCWNSGSISGTEYSVGGVIGSGGGNFTTISNCYNTGTVTGDNRIGGIVGNCAVGRTEIQNCFNTGDITQVATTDDALNKGGVGGIAGYGGCHFTNVYSYGNITGVSFTGGIIGYPMKATVTSGVVTGTTISNAYFGGTLSAPADSCGMILAKTDVTSAWNSNNSVTNAFYIDTCKVATSNTYGEVKTVKDFVGFNMGEGWKSDEAYCMPTITTNCDNDYARIYSLALITDDTDTYPTVTTDFFVGAPESVTWTPSVASVTVSGNSVHFTEPYTGELKLTAKSGDVEKTFIVNCKVESTGIDNAQSGKTVVSERYYTTGGVEISKPQATAGKQIYIVVRQYSDNTRESVREVR